MFIKNFLYVVIRYYSLLSFHMRMSSIGKVTYQEIKKAIIDSNISHHYDEHKLKHK